MRGFLDRSGSSKHLCRERLRRNLLRGRKAEWVLCRVAGLLTTGAALALVVTWLMDGPAFSLPPPKLLEEQLSMARGLRDFSESPVLQEVEVQEESQEQSREILLKKGEGLEDALKKAGLGQIQAKEIVDAVKAVQDLKRLREGTKFLVTLDDQDGRVMQVEAELDFQCMLLVERSGERLQARKEMKPLEVRQKVVSGTIQNSLFGAMDKAGLPASVTLALANIFDYDIDFHVDLRAGDRFDLLLEEKWIGDKRVGYGRILAARFVNKGRAFWAFYFNGKASQEGYFDSQGRSLRKAFLRSPLKFTRITSGFTQARLHPILQTYRPHLGVDYAAPTGTPVRAVADGRVVSAGWEGGFGNLVKIQHGQSYVSMYGHLSRFGAGIRSGVSVRQGQVIGYVGATGLATGPHLDFRLMKGGQFINPLKVNFINSDPVSPADSGTFRQLVAKRTRDLEDGSGTLAARTLAERSRP
ncbi:MAG: peptidoglycan DD-metalloendopeptidase family protein [bacterium]